MSDSGTPSHALTRFVILRLLALIYAVAFLVLVFQLDPLIGSDGLLPANAFLEQVRAASDSNLQAFLELPTLFWFDCSVRALHVAAWLGLGLSVAALLGVTNALVQLALWAIYLSFVQIGQLFYGYGWETQLLETGFLAVFLCPLGTVGPFPPTPPPVA